jgi:hypothetical protein
MATPGLPLHPQTEGGGKEFSDLHEAPGRDLLKQKSEINRQVQHEGTALQAHYSQAREARKGKES